MLISFLILGLLVSAITADETNTADPMFVNISSTVPSDSATISVNVSMANTTGGNDTSVSTVASTTEMQDNQTFTSGNVTEAVAPTTPVTTPEPSGAPEVTKPATEEDNKPMRTTAKPLRSESDSTGIIILVIILLVAVGFAVACVVARKRARRYSVDFTSRPDETNIPLSAVEPGMPADALPYNGKTFESAEVPADEEPGEEAEMEDEHKAEADKSVAGPSAESAAPPPDSVDDQPGADAADLQQQQQQESPPAPAEPAVEDKTDDEGVVSTKTSVESLKEANENNSNSADSSQTRDLKPSDILWEVPLNSPV